MRKIVLSMIMLLILAGSNVFAYEKKNPGGGKGSGASAHHSSRHHKRHHKNRHHRASKSKHNKNM